MFTVYIGDSITHSAASMLNMQFSTYDRDNDIHTVHCAEYCLGAWWYRNCAYSNLNGEYANTVMYEGNYWFTFGGFSSPLRFSEMKIRPA